MPSRGVMAGNWIHVPYRLVRFTMERKIVRTFYHRTQNQFGVRFMCLFDRCQVKHAVAFRTVGWRPR